MRSWSSVSRNVLDLARGLPDAEIISLALHDHGYDRHLLRFGPIAQPTGINAFFIRVYRGLRRRGLPAIGVIESYLAKYRAVDQTLRPGVLAQIQCILRKRG